MPEYTYFKYYQNINDDSKKTVKSTVQNFKNKIKNNKEFLNGFTFHIVTSYADLKHESDFTKYIQENSKNYFATGGLTISEACNNHKKEIIININNTGISSIWANNKNEANISQLILHEIGHQFDEYFGCCNKKLTDRVRQIPFSTSSKDDEKILSEYLKTKDLSDTKEFKSAWKKDIENLGGDTTTIGRIFSKLPFEYTPYEIDITDGVTDKEVEDANNARSEIFAQLVSYALGGEDKSKDVIIKKYKNSYTLVLEYLKKHLGIDCN